MEFNFEETFNSEEYLYFYRDILTFERLKKEIDFLVKYAELDQPLDILDLACGHGRHANALAQLGHQVTGLDLTDGFLKVAKKEALKINVDVKYIQQDMRELNLDQVFDRVFVLFTAIGYFDEDQNEKVFRNIFKQIGFSGVEFYENWEGTPLSQDSKRMIVVVRK
jgi:2-polyprenyl-3-methyl-5-hydroxy-6-metoxy-1,4-benzoquinol methylase